MNSIFYRSLESITSNYVSIMEKNRVEDIITNNLL